MTRSSNEAWSIFFAGIAVGAAIIFLAALLASCGDEELALLCPPPPAPLVMPACGVRNAGPCVACGASCSAGMVSVGQAWGEASCSKTDPCAPVSYCVPNNGGWTSACADIGVPASATWATIGYLASGCQTSFQLELCEAP